MSLNKTRIYIPNNSATCFDPNKVHRQDFAKKLYIKGRKCILYSTVL